jgi:YVTN family beta-propeller protein
VSYGLGIDLGTSFTRAAINRGGQSRMVSLGEQSVMMPSTVGVRADGTLVVGRTEATDDDPGRTGRDFKRRLGDPTPLVLGGQPHSAVSLLAATLRSVVEILTAMEGSPPDRVVLTYPAVWGPYRREQFTEVPRLAGLENVVLMTEPEAAARHYATRHSLADGQTFAIYDLGGGTFDSTVTRKTSSGMEILGLPEGVEWVGGVDFDEAVLAHVDQTLNGAISGLDPRDPIAARALQRIREECVRAKEQLSRDQATNIVVLLPHRHTQVRLTRAEFESRIYTPLEATLAALRRTIRSASVEIEALAGVLLVGGSSRIPLVSRMLSTDLGRPVLTDPRPQHCVALGAATLAGTGLVTSNDGSRSRPSNQYLHRRIVAATAATALLIGGGAYAALQFAPADGDARNASLPTKPASSPISASADQVAPGRTISGLGRRPQGVAVGPDGRQVFVPNVVANTLSVIDTATETVVRTVQLPGTPQYVAVSPDGRRLYVTLNDPSAEQNSIQVVDTSTWSLVQQVKVGKQLFAPAVSPDGLLLYVPDHASSRIIVLDTTSYAVKAKIKVPTAPHGAAFAPDGRRAYVVNHETSGITVLDVASNRDVGKIVVGAGPVSVAVAPNGRQVAVSNYDAASVSFVNLDNDDAVTEVKVGTQPLSVAYAADGRHLYAVNDGSDTMSVIDTGTGRVTATVATGREPWTVAVTPDGRHAYVANATADTVTVFDTATELPD